MIARLEGKICEIESGFLILDIAGVGYKVFVFDKILGKNKGEKLILYTYLYIRENVQELYGFESLAELKVFEALISVSGIGPKSAMTILSRSEVGKIKSAIREEDPDIFTAVSGVGKKTATKIIIELKSKFTKEELITIPKGKGLEDVLEALTSLGYSSGEARKVLSEIPDDIKSSQEKISWALKHLGK